MKNTLKVWLTKNHLTADPNDYVASVSSTGSVNFDDIIDTIVAEGVEIKRETLVDVIHRFQRISSQLVLNGHNVNTGQIYMRPVICGAFHDNKWNPEKNSIYVAINQGIELRKAAANTTVEILGEKADLMTIYRVTDMVTKLADGNLTIGRNVQIDGTYIKIAGDDPAVGVYFINTATEAVAKLQPEDIVTNDPSKLIIYIPLSLEAGSYRLKIVTQFSNNYLRKTPHEVEFHQEFNLS